MKKILILFLSSAVVLTACNNKKTSKKEMVAGDTTKTTTAPPKGDEHSTDNGVFSITAPAGWEKIDTTYEGQHVVFVRLPRESDADEFMENVNVVTEKVGTMGEDEYFERSVNNMESLPGFEKGNVFDKKVNGIDLKGMEYKHIYGGVPLDATVYFTIHDGSAYVITCTAHGGDREKYRSKFDEIVGSFRFN